MSAGDAHDDAGPRDGTGAHGDDAAAHGDQTTGTATEPASGSGSPAHASHGDGAAAHASGEYSAAAHPGYGNGLATPARNGVADRPRDRLTNGRNVAPLSGTARRVLSVVQGRPGVHFRGLLRMAGLPSAGQLRHHIDRLVRDGHVMEVTDGGFVRYFSAGVYDRRLRQELTRFARPVPRRVARLLLRGAMSRTSIRRSLDCADSTLGYYLARMQEEGTLRKTDGGSRPHYALADPESVRQVLEAQETATADGGGPPPEGADWPLPARADRPVPGGPRGTTR